MNEKFGAASKGLIGVVSPAGGIYISILPQIEAWLRVASLVAGIAVAGVTIWSLTRKKK